MRSNRFVTIIAASIGSASAFCPNERIEYHVLRQAMDQEMMKRDDLFPRDNLQVDLYLHNVASGPTYDDGYVPDDLLQQQYETIHEHYLPYGIDISLAGFDHTINKDWSNVTIFSQNEKDMKNVLHKGTYADINMYIVSDMYYPEPGNDTESHIGSEAGTELYQVSGYTYFPVSGVRFLSDFVTDGTIISYQAASGGNRTGRDRGLTAVHEIGHWFGLEHTFVRGCEGLGDGIADTPNEDIDDLDTNTVCPESRDTCPDQPGLDPVHNYMDTTSDECKTEFTPGQVQRMHTLFELLRLPKVP